MSDKIEIIVLAWYRREDYAKIRALAPDGGGMEPTFDDWEMFVRKVMPDIEKRGLPIKKVIIDPDAFEMWLRAEGLQSSPETRARFAHEIGQKKLAN